MVTGNCLLLRLAGQSSGRGKPDVCLVLYTEGVASIAGRLDALRAQVNQISEERNCLEEQREEGSSLTVENVTHPERAQRIAALSLSGQGRLSLGTSFRSEISLRKTTRSTKMQSIGNVRRCVCEGPGG
jgi:hypothetical protein